MVNFEAFLNPALLATGGGTLAVLLVYFIEFLVFAALAFALVYYMFYFNEKVLIIERVGDKGWELKTTRGRVKMTGRRASS